MKPSAMKATFLVKPSLCLERFLNDFKVSQPEVFDDMNTEIRKHVSLQAEALNRRYSDPRARIVYRLIRAKEERLMATLVDNRQLEENNYVSSK